MGRQTAAANAAMAVRNSRRGTCEFMRWFLLDIRWLEWDSKLGAKKQIPHPAKTAGFGMTILRRPRRMPEYTALSPSFLLSFLASFFSTLLLFRGRFLLRCWCAFQSGCWTRSIRRTVAFGVGSEPVPRAAHNVFQAGVLRLPVELPFDFFGACYQDGGIAGATCDFANGNAMTGDTAGGLDDFANAETFAVAEVVD